MGKEEMEAGPEDEGQRSPQQQQRRNRTDGVRDVDGESLYEL